LNVEVNSTLRAIIAKGPSHGYVKTVVQTRKRCRRFTGPEVERRAIKEFMGGILNEMG
jgi:hypothetical protein